MTPKQKAVLDYIHVFSKMNGYSPSQREIAKHFGFKSTGTVQTYLKLLEDGGHLRRNAHEARGAKIVENEIPLLGRVAAGKPIEALENGETVEVVPSMIRAGGYYYALRVSGDSMVGDGIVDQDIVVVRKQSQAENGQIAVVLVENEATIKRIFYKSGRVELHSSNPNYDPIVFDSQAIQDGNLKVEGIFCGLIRIPRKF